MSSQVLSSQAPERHALDAWVRLLRGHATLRRTFDAQLQAEHGLTVSDYEAMMLLSRAEDSQMRRVDLAEGLRLTASGITRLLGGLEDSGLVEKQTCSRDARVTYAVLTKTGQRKLTDASCSHVAAIHALFAERYTKKELATLADLLARLPGAGDSNTEDCTA